MTYSIVAKDGETSAIGIAVASRFFACGAMVPFVSQNAAVASQAFCNPLWGLEGIDRLNKGENANDIMSDFIKRDSGQSIRQAHMIDIYGNLHAHTGSDCVDWAGHASAKLVSVAGNMLVGENVVRDTLASYQDNINESFLDRLLLAMDAGEKAGGDKRGRQAAGIIIHMGQDYPWLDLRVDDHADPLAELRRLVDVSQERFVHFSKGLATKDNFSGISDRSPIDKAIIDEEVRRKNRGLKTRSFASPES
ncbi:MAG: pilus assembly protein [Rhodobacteraceae bacterium]|nr:pilus assembly protein [Paracoccaceae bacterium]